MAPARARQVRQEFLFLPFSILLAKFLYWAFVLVIKVLVKRINDDYGHECGDMALSSAADCIKHALRGSDIIFRYGGEEFVVLLSDTNLTEAAIIAERIRSNIERHAFAYGMQVIKLTVSLGVSSLRKDDNMERLIKRADAAMYQSKQTGRNRVKLEKPVSLA